jgi:hypothetical protein
MKSTIDYIDEDVAYFLGLLTARGEISQSGNVKRIAIEFPFKNLEVDGITKKYEQKNQLIVGLQPSIKRISELTEANILPSDTEHSVILAIESIRNSMFWRNVNLIMKNRSSYLEFEIPLQIYEATDQIKKEFLRGYADVAATARKSNVDQAGKHRIYLDVLNQNWVLPVELCHLLQEHLNIPVQTITYGHPNLRDPHGKEYKAGRPDAWAREHQIKVYCEAFSKVGFYMPHKQEILEELASFNRKNFGDAAFCSPPKKLGKTKFKHPGEKSEKLPKALRGKHYTAYWQICADLGCPRQPKCLSIFKPFMRNTQVTLKPAKNR